MKDTILEAFENRLLKMARHHGKWARKNSIEAYRVYDRDIPGVPFTIDRYGDHLYLCEFKKGIEDDFIRERNDAIFTSAAKVLGTPPEKIHVKGRERKRGSSQYEKLNERNSFFPVKEGDLSFYVNLDDYLDTGLFLDHRTTRSLFRKESKNKDVLNLFAYTGSFSVYAASGGASSITTVDLSHTYLDWAKDNFQLNGLPVGGKYDFIRADAIRFLESASPASYNLVIADVPTFSNSKSTDTVFDVSRDQNHFIQLLRKVTKKGGTILFATNFRKFQPDPAWFAMEGVKEITASTLPRDFRNEKIHKTFRIVL